MKGKLGQLGSTQTLELAGKPNVDGRAQANPFSVSLSWISLGEAPNVLGPPNPGAEKKFGAGNFVVDPPNLFPYKQETNAVQRTTEV